MFRGLGPQMTVTTLGRNRGSFAWMLLVIADPFPQLVPIAKTHDFLADLKLQFDVSLVFRQHEPATRRTFQVSSVDRPQELTHAQIDFCGGEQSRKDRIAVEGGQELHVRPP